MNETAEQAWLHRYGNTDVPESAQEFERFLGHRSIRRYSQKPVSEDLVRALIGVAQSAATSSNLQLWSVVSVQEPERRQQIYNLAAEQYQVADAPWLFCFLADHHRLREAALKAGEQPNGLDYVEYLLMAAMDAAFAAERMVCAAESIGLGTCYIGALRNHVREVAQTLQLPRGVVGLFGLCIGWPAEDAHTQIKPRLPQQSVWFKESYDNEPDVEEYDKRMVEFYKEQNMKNPIEWSKRSGRRVDENHLTGREALMDFLHESGFNKR